MYAYTAQGYMSIEQFEDWKSWEQNKKFSS